MHPDTSYIQALLNNDYRGIMVIYERFAVRVRRYVAANNGAPEDAQDVFQEALIAITRQARRPGFELTCPFEAYLLLVCKGKWLNELRRRQRAAVTISEWEGFNDMQDAGALAETTLRNEALDQLFERIFEQLPPGCRELLRPASEQDSMRALADQLNISYAYARKRKAECRAMLVERIKNDPEFTALK